MAEPLEAQRKTLVILSFVKPIHIIDKFFTVSETYSNKKTPATTSEIIIGKTDDDDECEKPGLILDMDHSETLEAERQLQKEKDIKSCFGFRVSRWTFSRFDGELIFIYFSSG